MKTNALVTINEIVEGIQMMTEIPEEHGFRIEQLVINAVKELNLLILDEGRAVEKYTMDSNYIIAMPSDLIRLNGACIPIDGELFGTFFNDVIMFENKGLIPSGLSLDDQLVEITELKDHPWFCPT